MMMTVVLVQQDFTKIMLHGPVELMVAYRVMLIVIRCKVALEELHRIVILVKTIYLIKLTVGPVLLGHTI